MQAPEAPVTVPLPRLRARDTELDTIARHLREAVAGRGGAVLVEGAAGTGKSRLLAETAALASSMGLAVAAAVADELTAAAPLGTLTEALRGGAPPVVTVSELEELAAAAGRRHELVGRLGELLAAYARRRPLLVSVDDVQWADPLTLLAVGTLPERPAPHPVLWVVSRRLLRAGSAVHAAIDRLAGAGATRLALEPLDPDAVLALAAELAGGDPGEELAARLADAAGNPAYVVELLRGLAEEERVAAARGEATLSGDHLPSRLGAVVQAHLRPLSEAARQLLEVGSVLGGSFTFEHATALLGQRPAEVRPRVAEAVEARILDEDEDGLVFRQEVVRRVVSDGLSESARQALHRDAGRLLLAEGAGAAAAVRHFAIGDVPGDEEAIGVLWQAARETFATAPGTAADLGLRALRLVRWEDARRPDLLAFVVPLLGSIGRLDDVEALATAALDGGLDAETEARVRLGLAVGMARAGRGGAAAQQVQRGLEYTGPRGGLAARLVAVQAELLVREDLGRSAELAAAAVRKGWAAGDADAVVAGRAVLACIALHRGHLSGALAMATRAVEVADGAGVPARLCHPRRALALALIGLGRFDEALAVIDGSRALGETLGSAWFLAVCGNLEALAHLGAGRLDDARAAAGAALAAAAGGQLDPVERRSHSVLAEVAVRQGDLTRARVHVERALALADDAWGLSDPAWQLARLTSAEEQPVAAMRALDDAYARLRRPAYDLVAVDPSRLPLLARMAIRSGDRAGAEVAAEAARGLADRNHGVRSIAGSAAHAEGLLRDDPALLATAVELLRAGPRPIALGEALEDLGRTLGDRGGDREAAVGALEEAHRLLTSVGAARDAARVRRLLRALGMRRRYAVARVRPMMGWDSLTESEQLAARLVADGLTNRAIAKRLFISPNTVATHLRHVFVKLGVRSRVDLTRIVVQQAADDKSD